MLEIYVVQQGDNIESIADKYGITVERLISDNGLINPYSLVEGQSLVILFPKKIYTIKPRDTLATIADSNGISVMQLIRNNPFLHDREYIYPDEDLVISYDTLRDVEVNGYTTAFISQDALTRSLPYLTYISIYNYRIAENDSSRIYTYGDDSNIIAMAKLYDTIPLMMISALSPTGELNVEYVYRVLLDDKLQDILIIDMLQILRTKDFRGVNLLISYLSEYNQSLYLKLFAKLSDILRKDGYIFMLTISPDFYLQENIDYNGISLLVDRIVFLQDIWSKRKQPPAPVSNISLIKPFIEYVTSKVSSRNISLGKPLIGFDWVVPFKSYLLPTLMSLNSSVVLAYDQNAIIQLDEESQTPFFYYKRLEDGNMEDHIVWFIDANSIIALDEVILDYDLVGTGIWNITSYNQQLFSITNVTYNIVKPPLT